MPTKTLGQVIADRDNSIIQAINQADLNLVATWHQATIERDDQIKELSSFIKDVQDGNRQISEIVVTDDGYRFKPVIPVAAKNNASQPAKEVTKIG